MRALERDRKKRYQSAEEMGDDLETYLRHSPAEPQAIKKLLSDLYEGETQRNTVSLPAFDPARPERHGDRGAHRGNRPAGSSGSGARRHVGCHPDDGRDAAAADRNHDAGHAAAAPEHARLDGRRVADHRGRGDHAVGHAFRPWRAHHRAWDLWPLGDRRDGVGRRAHRGESEPAGATVRGSRGMLGTTPFVVTLPASTEIEHLRFEKPGFEPQTYEVRPRSAGFVFVELQPAGTGTQ